MSWKKRLITKSVLLINGDPYSQINSKQMYLQQTRLTVYTNNFDQWTTVKTRLLKALLFKIKNILYDDKNLNLLLTDCNLCSSVFKSWI